MLLNSAYARRDHNEISIYEYWIHDGKHQWGDNGVFGLKNLNQYSVTRVKFCCNFFPHTIQMKRIVVLEQSWDFESLVLPRLMELKISHTPGRHAVHGAERSHAGFRQHPERLSLLGHYASLI